MQFEPLCPERTFDLLSFIIVSESFYKCRHHVDRAREENDHDELVVGVVGLFEVVYLAFDSRNEIKPCKTCLDSGMKFEVSILVFWVITSCGTIGGYQRFGTTYCLHLQG